MIEIAKQQSKERTMTIKPVPEKNCRDVVDFFDRAFQVEIPRPEQCLYAKCLLKAPLRRNGSYPRLVAYWGLMFTVFILRFRCRRCGRTISCPYSWLVPYCRFAAEVIAAGIERYADIEVTYRDASADLSDMEFADPTHDIRETEPYKRIVGEAEKNDVSAASSVKGSTKKESGRFRAEEKVRKSNSSENQRPVHTTVFYWVKSLCDRTEALLRQLQKEFVQEWKRSQRVLKLPAESTVVNPNLDKAYSPDKGWLLNQLTSVSLGAKYLVVEEKDQWHKLRSYFLTKAESCKDILTTTVVVLSKAQTFELENF